jgi:hypothetical protein
MFASLIGCVIIPIQGVDLNASMLELSPAALARIGK